MAKSLPAPAPQPAWREYGSKPEVVEAYRVTPAMLGPDGRLRVDAPGGDLSAKEGDYVVASYAAGERLLEVAAGADFEREYAPLPGPGEQLQYARVDIRCPGCGGVYPHKGITEDQMATSAAKIRALHERCLAPRDVQGKLPGVPK